jgi:hypothetical protein
VGRKKNPEPRDFEEDVKGTAVVSYSNDLHAKINYVCLTLGPALQVQKTPQENADWGTEKNLKALE